MLGLDSGDLAIIIVFAIIGLVMIINTAMRAFRDRAIAKATGRDPIAERTRADHGDTE